MLAIPIEADAGLVGRRVPGYECSDIHRENPSVAERIDACQNSLRKIQTIRRHAMISNTRVLSIDLGFGVRPPLDRLTTNVRDNR